MTARLEPRKQSRLSRREIHIGDADLGESKRVRPTPKASQPLHTIDLVALIHPLIIRTLHWPDETACASFAQSLATHNGLHDAYIELSGPLGAGKTTFVRHLLRALGVQGLIKSPTYAVLEPYQVGPLHIAHFDFYRFTDPREWEDAGFREVFGSPGLKLAEWPENVAGILPTPDLALTIEPAADGRRQVRLTAGSQRGASMVEESFR